PPLGGLRRSFANTTHTTSYVDKVRGAAEYPSHDTFGMCGPQDGGWRALPGRCDTPPGRDDPPQTKGMRPGRSQMRPRVGGICQIPPPECRFPARIALPMPVRFNITCGVCSISEA